MISNNRITHIDKNGDTSTQTVNNPTYDIFGNVIADNRPGTAADMTYTYDTLHGWLKGVSSPSGFSEQLLRETATNPQYSGNIGRMLWRNTANGEQHRYDYTYDTLGRLTSSQYSSSANGTAGRFNETVTYNPNGSIISLLRNGMKNDGTFGAIDSLTVTYDGNRLLKVTDDAEALNYNGALDFYDGSDEDSEYEYDTNGGLTQDKNRGITDITYDYGHNMYRIGIIMPSVRGHIINDYNSDGRKLLSRHSIFIPTGYGGYHRKLITDLYIDGLMLRNDTALLWKFSGGYVELNANGTPTCWNYYIADHLGSTRMVVDSNNSIKETINYYPFGSEMKMEDPALLTGGTSHPYRFTGKELEKLNNLNMYDFGARWYDVAGVPMWTSVDPLAEKYYSFTPYSYCAGDPVNAIDPDGEIIIFVNGKIGGGSPPAGEQYWNGINSNFVRGAQLFFKDKNVSFSNCDYGYFSSVSQRREDGYNYAKTQYNSWISQMKPDESFKLVSHSMGGAFSMGIEDYIKEQGQDVDYNVMINTYQIDEINVDKISSTFYIDYQNTNDPVLFWFDTNLGYGKLENSDLRIREKSDADLFYIHRSPIDGNSFWNTIKKEMNK